MSKITIAVVTDPSVLVLIDKFAVEAVESGVAESTWEPMALFTSSPPPLKSDLLSDKEKNNYKKQSLKSKHRYRLASSLL